MLFNELLAAERIDPVEVLVLRHTPWETALRKALPWLAAERPDIFNAYQSTQDIGVEAEMVRAKHVASFIGLKKRKNSKAYPAVFVGLYKVGEHRPLTYEQFWDMGAFQELKRLGMRGFVEGTRPSLLWFDLTLTESFKKWKGKLIVEWPNPPIKWSRFANKAKFPISAILEDSVLHEAMPDWKNCIWSWAELRILPSQWREVLRQWRGIYYIFDKSDGKGYVGSAYGRDANILGRWEHYEGSGHGGNVHLRERSPENFVFSILELVSPTLKAIDVMEHETNWKNRLHTRWPLGLNDN
jgi:hypothetical protein